jgi:hypothetical protein
MIYNINSRVIIAVRYPLDVYTHVCSSQTLTRPIDTALGTAMRRNDRINSDPTNLGMMHTL